MLSDFTVWKAWDFGVYVQTMSNMIVSGLVSIDNNLGLYPMILGPSATSHQFQAKTFDVKVRTKGVSKCRLNQKQLHVFTEDFTYLTQSVTLKCIILYNIY